ncbi:F-box only protein 36-like isoform X6 [Carcharodon carcharias]|uniref:F-box only protein 36-like isoform X6 n=1 Tax=Carcharodon carcharias TaxID=13397 RepID=UPI001B7E4646|nr:F-box only protein 36-like isoform X6 [Carcharodon carcharias]
MAALERSSGDGGRFLFEVNFEMCILENKRTPTRTSWMITPNKAIHVGVIFGNEVLKYVCNLCQHQFDYLNRIPEGLLMYIISFLELEDIARFSQTSRKFETACNSDKLWEHIVSRYCDTITPEMKALALEVGWKEIFFTNKLQLQKKIRRRRQKVEEFADYMTI